MRPVIRSVPVVFAAILFVSCSGEKSTQPAADCCSELRLEPLPDEQAELMALYLSAQVEAPLELYERIATDMARIRQTAEFPRSIETFRFEFGWEVSKIGLVLNPEGGQQLRAGKNPTWDSLNAIYQPWFSWSTDTLDEQVQLHFPGRLDSQRLAAVYRELKEVKGTKVWGFVWQVGKWRRQIYPSQGIADSLLYVFHAGTGPDMDDPSVDTLTCLFTVPDGVRSMGSYLPHRDEAPDWWVDFCPGTIHFIGAQFCSY